MGGVAHVADDAVGLGVAAPPDEQEMRLGAKGRFGLVQLAFEFSDAPTGSRLALGMASQRIDGPDEEQEGGQGGEKERIVLRDLMLNEMQEGFKPPLGERRDGKRNERDVRQQSAGDLADHCRSFSPSGEHESLAASLLQWIRSETHSLRFYRLDELQALGSSGVANQAAWPP